MRPPFNILFLGWWFAGQSRTSDAQDLPKPSISVSPSQVVVLGGKVNIHCKTERYRQMEFCLGKKKRNVFIDCKKAASLEAIFPILIASTEDAGIYFCQYHSPKDPKQWSGYSDEIYLNITDSTLTKPAIKLQPALGMALTIECQGPEPGLNFSLHKSRNLTAIEIVQPDGYKAHFNFHKLRLEDAGSYTCQYHRRGMLFIWSRPSDTVELHLIDSILTKPSIKLQTEPSVGMTVIFECQGPKRGLIFSLHKSTNVTAMQTVESVGYTAHFSFHILRLEDAGNYTCQYHHKEKPFIWSEPSDPVELVLEAPSSAEAGIRLGVAIVIVLVLVLILAEAKYSRRRKQG